MAIEGIPIYKMLGMALRWLPSFLVRRHYSPERLAKLIYCDFQPRCESAWINLGEAASVRLTLQIINLSPFPVEIDKANFRFLCGGATINLPLLRRVQFEPGEQTFVIVDQAIPDGHANQVAINSANLQAWLDGNIDFNCKVHSFTKDIACLSGVQLTIANRDYRLKRQMAAEALQ